MKKNFFVLIACISAFVGMPTAFAYEITDTAQVLSTRPVYRERVSQECHMEAAGNTAPQQQVGGEREMSGSIMGGIAGALLGAQVGQGNGRVAAAGAGAIAGAVAGDRLQNNGVGQAAQPQQVCRQVKNQEVSGYEVRYVYQGREGVTSMAQQPGSTIRVGIAAY